MNRKSQRRQNQLFILLGAVVACFAAFHNDFPLVYSDTGTYLRSGFEGELPIDRPIFYGLFLRHISLSESLWLVVFVQAYITSWVIHLNLGLLFNGLRRNFVFLTTITFITLATGFSYNVSILIPDIFTAIAVLAVLALLLSHELNRWQYVLLAIIFIFSICTHYSNLPIFSVLLLTLAIGYFWRKRNNKDQPYEFKKLLTVIGLFLAAVFIIPSVNYSYNGKFKYSEGSHVFLFNHMIEIGAVQQYLAENCEKEDFAICPYREDLDWDFLWNYESPLYKSGGWKANEKDFNAINNGIITTPKYWPLLFQKSVAYTAKQFFRYETTIQGVYKDGPPALEIMKYLKHSKREYFASRQINKRLNIDMLVSVESVVVFISIVWLFVLLILQRQLNLLSASEIFVVRTALWFGIVNAAVCSNLSTVIDRYQNRWIWILVILAIATMVITIRRRGELFNAINRTQNQES
jgi:hypothetical protein